MTTKTTTKTKTSGAITVTVIHRTSTLDKTADGVVYGSEVVSYVDRITLTVNGNTVIDCAGHCFRIGKKEGQGFRTGFEERLPAQAFGYAQHGDMIQPLSEATYSLIVAAMAEARHEAEADFVTEEEKPNELVINPLYADMTNDEIKKAERDYDTLHNEGGDGYNPYRDNLYVPNR